MKTFSNRRRPRRKFERPIGKEGEAYGVGRLNDTVADVARQLVLGRERDDEVARRRVILVPKREVGGRVQWLLGFERESVGMEAIGRR